MVSFEVDAPVRRRLRIAHYTSLQVFAATACKFVHRHISHTGKFKLFRRGIASSLRGHSNAVRNGRRTQDSKLRNTSPLHFFVFLKVKGSVAYIKERYKFANVLCFDTAFVIYFCVVER